MEKKTLKMTSISSAQPDGKQYEGFKTLLLENQHEFFKPGNIAGVKNDPMPFSPRAL